MEFLTTNLGINNYNIMQYNNTRPIYLQIADTICEKILIGEWLEGERIPSVRDLGGEMGVNPNTIVKVFDYLQSKNIIYNKRGIGYFVFEHAMEEIKQIQRNEFFNTTIPLITKQMQLLNISKEELIKAII